MQGRSLEHHLPLPASVGTGGIETLARCVRLSRTSLVLESSLIWEVGSYVRIHLRLETGRHAVAHACVCDVQDEAMMLRVIAIGPSFGRLLDEVMPTDQRCVA